MKSEIDMNFFEENVFNIPIEFIEKSIEISLKSFENGGIIPKGTDLKRSYFVGQTFVLDTEDEFGISKVITINFDSEDFGLFDGDTRRRLLTLPALRNLELLMQKVGINYESKPNLNASI